MSPHVCFLLDLILISMFLSSALVGWGSSMQAKQLSV